MSMVEKIFLQHPFLRYVSSALIMAFLFYFSSKSGSNLPPMPFGTDKIVHTIAYIGLGISFAFWFKPALWRRFRLLIPLIVIFLTVLFAFSDEFHQSFTPGRMASGFDLIADGIGAVIAVVLYRIYLQKFVFKNHPEK